MSIILPAFNKILCFIYHPSTYLKDARWIPETLLCWLMYANERLRFWTIVFFLWESYTSVVEISSTHFRGQRGSYSENMEDVRVRLIPTVLIGTAFWQKELPYKTMSTCYWKFVHFVRIAGSCSRNPLLVWGINTLALYNFMTEYHTVHISHYQHHFHIPKFLVLISWFR